METAGTPVARDTTVARPETKASREQVIRAFTDAQDILENAPDGSISPRYQAAKDQIREAKTKTIDKDKGSYTNKFQGVDGTEYTNRESIPVSDLWDFLTDEIDSGRLSEADQIRYRELRIILTTNSKPLVRGLDAGPEWDARVRQEYERIRSDSRLTTPGDTARDEEQAAINITHRWDLKIPNRTTDPPPPPPPPPPPQEQGDIDINIIPANEYIRKATDEVVGERVQREIMRPNMPDLPKNRFLRALRLTGHTLNPKNWPRIMKTNMKEYYRQQWMAEELHTLEQINFGTTTGISHEVVARANQLLAEKGSSGQSTIERLKLEGGTKAGETGLTEVQGPLRDYVLNDILRPLIASGVHDDAAAEADIQKKLYEYVQSHQGDEQVRDFFGHNSSKYGEVSKFYASDMVETAKKIISDEKANAFANQELDAYIHVRIARASWAEKTEAKFSAADRLMAFGEKHNKLKGWLINPATAGVTASALTFLGQSLFVRGATGAAVIAGTPFAAPISGAVAGGVYAGLRRNWDLKEYMQTTARGKETGEGKTPNSNKANQERELEAFLMDMATPGQLLGGGGRELVGGQDRVGLEDLLGKPLSVTGHETAQEVRAITQNREALARRYGEIQARLDYPGLPRTSKRFIVFGEKHEAPHMGLIAHEGGRKSIARDELMLVRRKIGIQTALLASGMTQHDLDTNVSAWNQKFTANQTEQERNFRIYRLKEALIAAGGAAAVGGALGLGGQEAFALAGRAMGRDIGATLAESVIGKGIGAIREHAPLDQIDTSGIRHVINPLGEATVAQQSILGEPLDNVVGKTVRAIAHEAGFDTPSISDTFNIDMTKELYKNPANLRLDDHFTLAVGPDHAASILDNNDVRVPTPPMRLLENGHLVMSGSVANLDKLPADLRALVEGMQHEPTVDPEYNVNEDIKDMLKTGRHGTFVHGNMIIDINPEAVPGPDYNPNATHVMSMTHYPTGTMYVGEASMLPDLHQPEITIDPTHLGNEALVPNDAKVLTDELNQDAWVLKNEAIAGKEETISVLDQLFKKTPAELAALGIVETDQFSKRWNFHVLRPDIVSSTGMHTHNELTIHVGQFRGWQAGPGLVSTGAELTKGEIASHLRGIPGMPDKVLGEFIDRNGIPHYEHMVGVVDLTDGRQIMTPFDQSGNLKLPQELYNPQNGELRGISTIATVLLEKSDGSLLKAQDVLAAHDIPAGTLVHSLASEKFPPGDMTHVIKTPPYDILHATPPGAIDITPPDGPFTPPPFIPVPELRRRPLEPGEPETPDIPSGYYTERFKSTDTLRDLIRFGKPIAGGAGPRRSPDTSPDSFHSSVAGDPVEGERALRLIHETFDRSPHVYITLSSAIGDVVFTTGYIEGIRRYAEQSGTPKKITLVAPANIHQLLQPLVDKFGYEIISQNRHECVDKAKELIDSAREKNAMVFDFDFTLENGPNPILEETSNDNLVMHELLSTAVGLYKNDRSGTNRFSDYLGDLLDIPAGKRFPLLPYLPLPDSQEAAYQDLKTRFGIDESKKQVAIVVEGSSDYKRYDLSKWKEIIDKLSSGDTEFNIVYNPDPRTRSYSEDELRRVFGSIPNARIIGTNLGDSAIFLAHQQLVLSNDTGLAHIAAVVENGPQVISLHALNNTPNAWVSNSNRQFGIWSGGDNLPTNAIETNLVVMKANEFLQHIAPFALITPTTPAAATAATPPVATTPPVLPPIPRSRLRTSVPPTPTPASPTTPAETQSLDATAETGESLPIAGIGFSEMQGRRNEMEDAHTVVENFGGNPDQTFVAIYDGHGGKAAADVAAENLHEELLKELKAGKTPDAALRIAYETIDRLITTNLATSGTTAITAFINGDDLFIANAGDARAVLGRNDTAERLSHDHKANDPAEVQRIRQLNGFVANGRVGGVIAVARALGDKDMKPYVTAEPAIIGKKLRQGDTLILACDGLWDVVTDQTAVSLVKDIKDPKQASEVLRQYAYDHGSGDNISVLVVKV